MYKILVVDCLLIQWPIDCRTLVVDCVLIVNLFSIKIGDSFCCFDTEFPKELVTKCKKATMLSLGIDKQTV